MRWRSLDTDAGWIAVAAVGALIAAFTFNALSPGFLTARDIDDLAGSEFAPLLLLTISQMLLLRVHRLEPALIGVSTLVGTLSVYWNTEEGVAFGYAVILAVALVVLVFAVVNGLISASLTAPAALGVSVGVFLSATIISGVLVGTRGSITVPPDGEFMRLEHENVGGLPATAVAALIACAIAGGASLATGLRRRDEPTTRGGWVGLYACAASLSALAGILPAVTNLGVNAGGDETLQEGWVIAALLAGGASLYGRRGSVTSAFVGAAFVAVITWGVAADFPGTDSVYEIFAIWGLIATACFLLDYFTRDRASAPHEI
jgi:ribose/xylose/arabinose/galactoside ABC-type transport system permease subunit